MSEPTTSRLHAIINGHVQGVGYRYFVQETAAGLNVYGWVRNRPDGSVETTAEGDRAQLEKFLAALYRGPRSAYVTDIDFDWLPATGEFKGFNVRMTGW